MVKFNNKWIYLSYFPNCWLLLTLTQMQFLSSGGQASHREVRPLTYRSGFSQRYRVYQKEAGPLTARQGLKQRGRVLHRKRGRPLTNRQASKEEATPGLYKPEFRVFHRNTIANFINRFGLFMVLGSVIFWSGIFWRLLHLCRCLYICPITRCIFKLILLLQPYNKPYGVGPVDNEHSPTSSKINK